MKRYIITILVFLLVHPLVAQQVDSTYTNLEAIYRRPFIFEANKGRASAAVGGYIEGNTNYFETDGITEGWSMELRRFNLFLFASVHERIKFLAELEFEHGTKEIALETALLDFEIHPACVFRIGILLPPLGYFNQNHDSPKWGFIDRPWVSTHIIPSTLSEVGLGVYGKIPVGFDRMTYEVYLTNGLQNGIIANTQNRTWLAAGKTNDWFEKDNNGVPALSGRWAWRNARLGEVGVSGYRGLYNTFHIDGQEVEAKRHVSLLAVDYHAQVGKLKIIGETAWTWIDLPPNYGQQFGEKQWGTHLDVIYPVMKSNLLGWKHTTLNLVGRWEYVDYNVGKFVETAGKMYDEAHAIVAGASLRFSPNTLLRLNYRTQWVRDLFGNPATHTAGMQLGFASYF